ncbi:flavodoxin family protein [Tissierella praeacuta]|uniref:flavodoxin family protein n=1 Tax=Tissierella praeacuta TaxID=43131 RepID=UPI00351506E9
MKVIGIGGSPRNNGNTEYFIRITLDALEREGIETEYISLREKTIDECSGCYYCIKERECSIKDDFQDIFKKMVEANGIILGSPVYHAGITPKLKALLDRAGFLCRWIENDMVDKNQNYDWKGTAFSRKVVSPITVARRAGQNFAFAQILLWATVNDCIVVGSNYWNIGVAGVGGRRDADEDLEGIGTMEHLASNIAYVIKNLNNQN